MDVTNREIFQLLQILQTDISCMKTDISSMRTDITNLQYDMRNAQDTLKEHSMILKAIRETQEVQGAKIEAFNQQLEETKESLLHYVDHKVRNLERVVYTSR